MMATIVTPSSAIVGGIILLLFVLSMIMGGDRKEEGR
jgi:small neutral amino acid transporter SnatA (MarC family)